MIRINGHKVLTTMIRRKSPHTIIFFEDVDDDYLIHVAKVKTRTGDIADESLIIRPDIDTWIESYKRRNFFIEK